MNIFLIHGAYGNGTENWFPWAKEELEKLGYNVIVPQFPTPDNQRLNEWMRVFKNYREYITKDTIFIGHSIGCAFILSILETLNLKIKGCILVAGFIESLQNETFDAINKTFIDKEFDWKHIRNHCEQFYVLQSKDDPYVDFSRGITIAQNLKTMPIPYENAGHFNTQAGYSTFQDILRFCYLIEHQRKFQVENLIGLQSLPTNPNNKAVILIHGFGTNKHEWGRYDFETEHLTRHGYSVFRFDCTGRGESKGDYSLTSIDVMAQDLDTICEYVHTTLGFEKYAIIAQSMGTNATIVSSLKTVSTIILCASISDVDTYLTPIFKEVNKTGISKRISSMGERMEIKHQYWDAYESYNLKEEVSKINKPILFIHGTGDTMIPPINSQEYYDVANEPKKLVLLEGANHHLKPCWEELVREEIKWLKKYL